MRANFSFKTRGSGLQPSEWVVLGFLVFSAQRLVFLRQVSFAETNWGGFLWVEILLPIFAAMLVKLVRSYRSLSPPESGASRRLAESAVLPSLVALSLAATCGYGWSWPALVARGPRARAAGEFLHAWRHLVLLGLAGLVLRLGIGVESGKNPDFDLFGFLKRSAASVAGEIRSWWPLLAIIYMYPLVPLIQQRSGIAEQDGLMQAIDRSLFLGRDPLILLQGAIRPWLSEWMAVSYVSYTFLFLYVFVIVYIGRDVKAYRRLVFALTLCLALGYAGYSLVPVRGPMFARDFAVRPDLYYMKEIMTDLMDRTRVSRDCFPSLHTAISIVLMWASFRSAKLLFWIFLPVVAFLPIACVYLRYHYVIDVLCGIALAVFVIWSSERVSFREIS